MRCGPGRPAVRCSNRWYFTRSFLYYRQRWVVAPQRRLISVTFAIVLIIEMGLGSITTRTTAKGSGQAQTKRRTAISPPGQWQQIYHQLIAYDFARFFISGYPGMAAWLGRPIFWPKKPLKKQMKPVDTHLRFSYFPAAIGP